MRIIYVFFLISNCNFPNGMIFIIWDIVLYIPNSRRDCVIQNYPLIELDEHNALYLGLPTFTCVINQDIRTITR